MKPPTYPARPINGGPYPKAREKGGQWIYEPKYNGWRALVHIDTGLMFNRHGEPLSIRSEFRLALDLLPRTLHSALRALHSAFYAWADVEALDRRHGIGRGCLVVLDSIPEPLHADATYTERRQWLTPILRELNLAPPWSAQSDEAFPLLSIPPLIAGNDITWRLLQEINKLLGCHFYEGLVAKRADSVYPIQLRSPEEAFPFWVKHRWQW